MFLYKVLKNGSHLIRIKESSQKSREIAISSLELKSLDKKVGKVLSKVCAKYSKSLLPIRIHQSKKDIHFCKNYKYLQYGDIKSAFESSNIIKLIIFNFFFNPIIISAASFYLIIIYYSAITKSYSLSNIKYGKLRPGLSVSGYLFNITQRNIYILTTLLTKIISKNTSPLFQIYVDDFVIYSNQKQSIENFIKLYIFFNQLLGFKTHPQKTSPVICIESKAGVLLDRLGLIIWKSTSGKVISSIRKKTIKKYLSHLKAYCCKHPTKPRLAVSYTRYLLYGRARESQLPDYSLFNTFPGKVIWTDNQQKKLVAAKFLNTLRKQYPSSFSKTSNSKFKELIFR